MRTLLFSVLLVLVILELAFGHSRLLLAVLAFADGLAMALVIDDLLGPPEWSDEY